MCALGDKDHGGLAKMFWGILKFIATLKNKQVSVIQYTVNYLSGEVGWIHSTHRPI